jgi:hypothetical protein
MVMMMILGKCGAPLEKRGFDDWLDCCFGSNENAVGTQELYVRH